MPVTGAPPFVATRRRPPADLRWLTVRLAVLPLALVAGPAAATECPTARVADAGDRLRLDQPFAGSDLVRLAGILAPQPPTAAAAPAEAAADQAARQGLAALVDGQCLRLVPDQPPVDRYRRLVAWVYRADGRLVQADLVRLGRVRVMPGVDEGPVADLLTLEEDARREGRGLWADPAFRIRTPADLAGAIGSVQLVEGTVRRTARVGAMVYLNFGDDWRSDFTVSVPARRLATFAAAGRDPLRLGGKRVRVRGLVQQVNGPLIELDVPEAIEVLDGAQQGERQVIRLATGSAP